ncbi:hypothetical protein [Puia dinghuensis]|uniref:DUF695 domain-containing protein n=1 Tax=Puia dinghuensis TaxID=1792502 RepID=A0A8J2ULV1_9BACT|nr:hypothetical protein [Puia dinghuensis]GGB26520.1 hypothetical protein GCM10011511_58060 [Puia dinghuensis]
MGNHKINTLEVRQFWEWFSKNCQNFGVDFSNAELLEKLDNWVTQLGDFSWEVGPGKAKDNALVISPNGDEDLLQDSKLIITSAKDCEGWEYYYAKPPKEKEWNLIFSLETSEGEIVEVDASQWEYTLLQYEDGMFEIIVKAPDLQQLDEADKQAAAEILLDGILGEEARMQTICAIDIVEKFEEPYRDKAGNIKYLPNHLKTLVKE